MIVPGIQPNKIIMPIVKSANASKAKAAAKLSALGLTPWALAEMMQEPTAVTKIKKQAYGDSILCDETSYSYNAPDLYSC